MLTKGLLYQLYSHPAINFVGQFKGNSVCLLMLNSMFTNSTAVVYLPRQFFQLGCNAWELDCFDSAQSAKVKYFPAKTINFLSWLFHSHHHFFVIMNASLRVIMILCIYKRNKFPNLKKVLYRSLATLLPVTTILLIMVECHIVIAMEIA